VRVLIASTYVPFIKGGGTKIAEDLCQALTARGFETDTVMIPFAWAWPEVPAQTVALRLLDVTESCGNRIDRLIAIRYPSYALNHPNKVAWFIHHHREAYDLWGTPYGGMPDTGVCRHYRDLIRRSDDCYLRECRKVFTNSRVVADRLRTFNDLEPEGVLYPPLGDASLFRPGPFGDYLFYASRLTPIKRQGLAIEALRYTSPDVRLVIAGGPDVPAQEEELRRQVAELGLEGRVELVGRVSEQEKADLMAGCCGALYLAYAEDSYGYVTLEAFHSAKPVITLTDSGGPLEVIEDGVNGLVAEPQPQALAAAMDRLWKDRAAGQVMGERARDTLGRYRIDWDHVVENLTS
jgi:glycosyltransferase involved in cell wall biosynthesis